MGGGNLTPFNLAYTPITARFCDFVMTGDERGNAKRLHPRIGY